MLHYIVMIALLGLGSFAVLQIMRVVEGMSSARGKFGNGMVSVEGRLGKYATGIYHKKWVVVRVEDGAVMCYADCEHSALIAMRQLNDQIQRFTKEGETIQ